MTTSSDKAYREIVTVRDTVESIWVAVVLAFVLRAFMFEAFVIPTGSMAPRLVGEHWDLRCPSCGYEYAFGLHLRRGEWPPRRGDEKLPPGAACPQCGYPYPHAEFVNGGDRVLVLKYIYNFMEPRPWDVVVFRNPQNNQENYIKRLVGLPGETIEIINGDIFVRQGREAPLRIRRKDRRKIQEAMWQIVHINDYQPNMEMIAQHNTGVGPDRRVPAPPVWQAVGTRAERWDLSADGGRRFAFRGDEQPCELEFRAHRVTFAPRYGYNPSRPNGSDEGSDDVDVCSDLDLCFTFVPKAATSRVSLLLSSLHHRFRAEVCADGTVSLYRAHPDAAGGAETLCLPRGNIGPLEVGRGYRLALWHADYRVTLWVDEQVALQTTDAEYSPDPGRLRSHLRQLQDGLDEIARHRSSAEEDDQPPGAPPTLRLARVERQRVELLERMLPTPAVAIIAQGGPCELTHVSIMRDVYYTYQRIQRPNKGDSDILTEYAEKLGVMPGSPGWGVMGNPITLKKDAQNPDLDEFFVLGDNSPQSLDGRAWVGAAPTLRLWQKDGRVLGSYEPGAEPLYTLGTVPRYSLIGRALFVYWPSGFRPPGLQDLPFIPNVGRMRLIR